MDQLKILLVFSEKVVHVEKTKYFQVSSSYMQCSINYAKPVYLYWKMEEIISFPGNVRTK